MSKKIKIAALSLLGLLLVLLIAVILYIRSGGLDNLLRDQIIAVLQDSGVRAEIGGTRVDLTGSKVTLENIRLYAEGESQPFATVEKLEGEFSVISYLNQRVDLKKVVVTRPEVWFTVDEKEQSFISKLKSPPRDEESEEKIRFFTTTVEVIEGKLHLDDRKNAITADLNDLNVTFTPRDTPTALTDQLNHKLAFGFTNATATYKGQPISAISLSVEGEVTPEQAEFPSLSLKSSLGNLFGRGRVTKFSPLTYSFQEVKLDAALGEVARVFAPAAKISGTVKFEGEVSGEDDRYQAKGMVTTEAAAVEGFQIADARVTLDASGKGADYNATADILTARVSNRDLSISSIQFSNATVTGKEAAFDATGNLRLSAIKSGRVDVRNLSGRLRADNNSATLSQFNAQALGGSVAGTATVAFAGGRSNVDVRFTSIDLNQVATLAAAKDVTASGNVNGTATLSFPGVNYKAATGRVKATFDAAVGRAVEGAESAAARGEVNLVATGRGFDIEKATVNSASSTVTATGSMGWDGVADLNVAFTSTDMAEVQRVVDSFGILPEEIQVLYEIAVKGAGEFKGRVQGKLGEPSVSGRLRLESITMHDDLLGSLEGDIAFLPNLLRVENGVIKGSNNSRADFTLNAPLKTDNQVAVNARVSNFDLPTIVKLASPGFDDVVSSGVINGDVNLRGLPGPRTIEGTANVTLTSGEFKVIQEEGKDPRTISVPEFVGNVTFAKSVLSVDNLKMNVGGSAITGRGSFNLDTYAYSLDAEGKGVDLAQIGEAVADNLKLTGVADVNVKGQGNWGKDNSSDWSNVNLNATIQGQGVSVNGRDLGDAKIVAKTVDGVVNIEATGSLLDKERTLTATVDLRDRKNYPVNSLIEFTDEDLGQYLGLVSPDLAKVSGRATGTIRISGPLQEPNEIRADINLSKLELGGSLSAGGRQYTITNQGNVVIVASAKEITIEPVTFVGEGTSITLVGTVGEGTKPRLSVNGELNLGFVASLLPDVTTSGVAQVQATIGGSLEAPQILGLVSLREVGVRVVNFPVSVARGYGQIRFTSNQALIEDFTASAPGGGRVSVAGGAALTGLVPDRFRLEATVDQVAVEYPRDTLSVADAAVTFQGNQKLQILSGTVKVRRATYTKDITIEELIRTGGPFTPDFYETGPGGKGDPGPPITFDIRIEADNTIVVRNNLANAIGSASLYLRGPAGDPVVSGRLQFSQGYLEFRNERHEITRALITVPPRRNVEPFIDLQTEADISGYRITTDFNGTPSKLKTTLRSDPDLPEGDIVSLLLTGSVSGDSRTNAAVNQSGLGLAQSLLAAGVSEQIEKGTERLFGLNRFSIDPLIAGRGADPTARVTVGRRVTRDLTITYSQNLTSSGQSGLERIVLVEYRLSNRLSVVGYRNERGDLGFDMRLRKRF